jgi:two-component system phosphate regulon sensor histidine kinase PhoR
MRPALMDKNLPPNGAPPAPPLASGAVGAAAARVSSSRSQTSRSQTPRSQAPRSPDEGGLPSAAELEQTLRRVLRRVAMMIQAEKCLFLLHDRERNELVARPPTLGITPDRIRHLRLPTKTGLCGRAFSEGAAQIVNDLQGAQNLDAEIDCPWLERLGAQNLIVYPLVVERHDEQQRVADRVIAGVLCVLNRRGGEDFGAEDVRVLSVMARQVTAVLADAQIYLQLTEQKEQLQATLQSMLAGVLLVESSGHVSLINSAACQMFGVRENAVLGRHFEEVIPQEALVRMLRAAVHDGEEQQEEIEIEPQDGHHETRIFQAQTGFVRGEKDGLATVIGVVAIFNDITAIRNVERMKTAFVSTVSHELRTPLTSIKGYISTLLNDTEGYFDAEMRREFYEIVDAECDRLRRLIDDLLNVSRIESGRALQMNWSNFNPVTIAESVIAAMRSFSDRHEIRLQTLGDIPDIVGDADKFDQILNNLLSNAIKYSPKGGPVRLEMKNLGERLYVAVHDKGIGIPADKLSRLFEKFERVDNRDTRQAGGTGIGLFLVKHLVEQHGGEVGVYSELGKGSTFYFEIPHLPPQAEADSEADLDAGANDAGQTFFRMGE